MAYTLGNNCAKNICKLTVLLNLSTKMWSHVFWNTVRISPAYAVVRCLSVTFVYCVETAKDTATVAMECE